MSDRIYTRTGDGGDTGLFGGGRVSKMHPRVEAYGDVDELNAVLGRAGVAVSDATIRERLHILQADLFAIGAHLATPAESGPRPRPWLPPLPDERAAEIEAWIDDADTELPALESFILPGGSAGAAALHVARTVCRRAERRVVRLAQEETVDPLVLVLLNRMSDYLFTAARLENRRTGTPDRIWDSGR
ncbi:MAG: cob(I)yrinic acid a,c-diamide adenosyltransferase [Gemmatimonadota bacterium]|jgi:cob(I)alamin adenosyltransferase